MASAGVYATIPATLKGSRTPWPEKLKLARAAWSSTRCLLPNKEQLLLDWACNSLSSYYSRKLPLGPGVATQLWAFLGEVLGSARVRGEGRPVSLRAPVAQMLVERLCELAGLRAAEGAGAGGAELETPSPATLLACFQDILRTPPLRTILAAKLELLARLLRALLTMACRSLLPPAPAAASREERARRGGAAPVSSSDSPSVASLLQVLSQTLALYAATQRQQVNPQRVFRLLTGQLLGPAVVLRHLLLSEGGIAALGAAQEPPPTLPRDPAAGEAHAGARAPVARDIRSRLEAAVAAALFHADLLPSYRDELLPPRLDAAGGSKEQHRKAPGKSSSGLAPLRTILDVVSSPGVAGWDGASAADDVDPVPCGAVPLLYRQLLEAYGGSSDSAAILCFRALRRMVAALGVEPGDAAAAAAVAGEEEAEGTGAASNIDALGSRHTLLALDQLLSAVAAADVYNVAVDRIQHGALQFAFYERLAAALLARPSSALPAWHRCLRSLLGLNHLILEPHLQALVSIAWLGPEPPEPRGRKARDALLCVLLATYAKLRQLAKPLGAAFSSLCRDDDDDGSPRGSSSRLVGTALGDKLSECLAELPAGQAADVWELALEAVRSRLPPPGAPERGGPRWARPLPSVALLLHAVLFRARSPDASWPAPAVARATRLMEATLREALAPLLLLCRAEGGAGAETAPALEAALTLAHTWAELDLCFQLNCPRYRSPGRDAAAGAVTGGGAETVNDGGDDGGDDGGFAADASVGTYDFRCLAPAVPARVWRELTRPLRRSGGGDSASGRARFLLATLSVQKVRALSLRRAVAGSRGYARGLRRAAHLAVRLAPWADGARQAPWDGELASVDEASRAAAHWRLVLGHLPLLLPHLVPGDVQAVADAVTDAALASPDDEGAGDAGGATPRALAWALLRGPLLPELGAVQAAVVTALVARAAEALGAGDDDGAGREGAPPSSLLPALARRDLPWAAEASAAARKAAYVRPHRDDGDVDAEDAPPARAATWALLDEVAQGMLGRAAAGAEPPRFPPARLAALERVLDALAAQRLDAAPPGTAARCFLALFAVVSSVAPADEASLRLLTRCCRLLAALQRGGTGAAGAAGAPRAVSPAETLEALARPLLRAGACAASFGAAAETEHRRAVRGLFRAALLAIAAQPRGRRGAPLAVRAFSEFLLAQADGAGWCRAATPSVKRRRRSAVAAPSSTLLEMATAFLQAALADSAAARRRSYTTELDAVTAAAAAAVGGLLDADDSVGVDAADEKLELLVVPAAVLLEAELQAPGGAATEGLRHGAVYARVFERVARRLRSYEGGEDARRRVASHAGFLRLLLRGAAGERGGGVAETTAPALFSALADLLAAPGVTREEFSALRPQLSALGAPLAAACGAERLRVLLLELLGALSAQRLQGAHTQEAVSALRLCQLLALADLEGGPCDAFWRAAPRFLSAIVTVTREAPRWLAGEAHAPVLAALDCAATLLARGGHWDVAATTAMTTATTTAKEEETPIESGPPPRGGAHGPRPVGPHGPAALAMQAVLAAPLERLTPARHHEMFHACHELLFAIMQMHPQVMLRAAPAFLGCFHKLVRSAMHEGRLRGDGDKGTGGGEAAELAASCAQTAERLYVQVAARVQEFPALAGFMAAQFVQELQKASLRAEVRRPLAEGAYAVLDLCREQDARMVAATLPSHGLRELFRQLQADHHKHHKYLSPRALALEPDEE